MKTIQAWISLLLICLSMLCVECSKEPDPEKIPVDRINFDTVSFVPSMKGWELYSWPNGDDYNHSLLPGTNRIKTYGEVTHNRFIVFGVDSLKMLLGKIPAEESIFWIGRNWLEQCWGGNYSGNLELPDIYTMNEIKEFCIEQNLILGITN